VCQALSELIPMWFKTPPPAFFSNGYETASYSGDSESERGPVTPPREEKHVSAREFYSSLDTKSIKSWIDQTLVAGQSVPPTDSPDVRLKRYRKEPYRSFQSMDTEPSGDNS
jgi:hypothetical protein